jgi:hypothetical protein
MESLGRAVRHSAEHTAKTLRFIDNYKVVIAGSARLPVIDFVDQLSGGGKTEDCQPLIK